MKDAVPATGRAQGAPRRGEAGTCRANAPQMIAVIMGVITTGVKEILDVTVGRARASTPVRRRQFGPFLPGQATGPLAPAQVLGTTVGA